MIRSCRSNFYDGLNVLTGRTDIRTIFNEMIAMYGNSSQKGDFRAITVYAAIRVHPANGFLEDSRQTGITDRDLCGPTFERALRGREFNW